MANTIHQGDQFSLPFKITLGGTVVTPNVASDIRIQIDDTLKTYSKSELTYDSTNQVWKFPLTEAWTRARKDMVEAQVGVKIEDDIYNGGTLFISIGENIIKEEW